MIKSIFDIPSITESKLISFIRSDVVIEDAVTGVQTLQKEEIYLRCYLRPTKPPKDIPLPGNNVSGTYLSGWIFSATRLDGTILSVSKLYPVLGVPLLPGEEVPIDLSEFNPKPGREMAYERGTERGRFIPIIKSLSVYPLVREICGVPIEGWLVKLK